MAEQILYVVLHGLISVVQDKDKLHLVVIAMEDHREGVGHWLTEVSLPRSVAGAPALQLRGLDATGTAGLDESLNMVVDIPGLDVVSIRQNAACFAMIDVPRPRKCYSYFIGDASTTLSGTARLSSAKYAAVQVLEYAVPGDDFSAVQLTGAAGLVWSVRGYTLMVNTNNDKVTVVHIYNEPDGATDTEHSRDEFLKGSALFGVDLGFAKAGTSLPFPSFGALSQVTLPLGLLIQELTPLAFRETQVFHILDPLRSAVEAPSGKPVGGSEYCGWAHVNVA